jgi:hypothetical protein
VLRPFCDVTSLWPTPSCIDTFLVLPWYHKQWKGKAMEYVIWGLTADQTDKLHEQPLYTNATSMEQARKVMRILAEKHNCHAMRIQVIDGTIPDFAKTLA